MDNEYYNLYLEFTVQESDYNMEKGGTIYLASKMTSQKGMHSLTFHRMGNIMHKGSLFLSIKQFFRYIPLISHLCNCEPS
jgi:hypothetical protein